MKEKLLGYYGLKEGEKVTLRTLLGKSSIEVISKARKAADEEIQTAIEALPALDLKVSIWISMEILIQRLILMEVLQLPWELQKEAQIIWRN